MTHIKEYMQKLIEHGAKAKFYQGNKDLFLRYFDSQQQYEALISAGNFKKMEEVIDSNRNFNVDKFIEEVRNGK